MPEAKPKIALTEVTSSQLHSVGHDPETGTLHIRFRGKDGPGPIYSYANVPAAMHQEFLDAPSIGQFFGQRIKSAKDEDGNPLHPFTTKLAEEEKDEQA